MTRRELLALPAVSPLLRRAWARPVAEAQNISYSAAGGIEGSVTPPDLFFVRDHFHEPEVSLSAWKLKIEGRVESPLELSLADILESPTKKIEAVLECAGNAAGGPAASNGHVGRRAAGPSVAAGRGRARRRQVMLEGADSGRLMPDSPNLPYSRSSRSQSATGRKGWWRSS